MPKKLKCIEDLWETQEEFMRLLQQKRNFPEFPVNLDEKSGQRIVKEVINDCMGELFEASYLLKNSKNHRLTDTGSLDVANFVEELVDAQKFLIEILILSGISVETFKEVFDRKSETNFKRINEGY